MAPDYQPRCNEANSLFSEGNFALQRRYAPMASYSEASFAIREPWFSNSENRFAVETMLPSSAVYSEIQFVNLRT
ncbi:hypothetical protein GCM10010918_37680 [Paenibacillus radicis (ex Gao et al. 2016)]|uniref:Uncharacterized protein n=1 Tax=Paenibacillus radicis (ex Gao et al. 2016) TaxID=1737354 RepID=A0A917HFE0_9BACL|nr:hypothetical protein GCM10010918_37680 [Paenibacillus radicis (ex Gao et al. 2016)]